MQIVYGFIQFQNNRRMKIILALLATWFVCQELSSQILSEWRGIGRTGVYNESKLLKQWPKDGPSLLWHR